MKTMISFVVSCLLVFLYTGSFHVPMYEHIENIIYCTYLPTHRSRLSRKEFLYTEFCYVGEHQKLNVLIDQPTK